MKKTTYIAVYAYGGIRNSRNGIVVVYRASTIGDSL